MYDDRKNAELDPVEKAELRFNRAKARLEKERALRAQRSRKEDTHKKILTGALMLAKARKAPGLARIIAGVIREAVLTNREATALGPILQELDEIAAGAVPIAPHE